MPKKAPRPKLRDAVGETKEGRNAETAGPRLDMLEYDIPFELGGKGRIQWLQWSADPLPWWSDADLPTVAQYCAALDAIEAARGGSAAGLGVAHKELRHLADALGLTPMSRARLGLRKTPVQPDWDDADAENPGGPAEVISLDDLLDDRHA